MGWTTHRLTAMALIHVLRGALAARAISITNRAITRWLSLWSGRRVRGFRHAAARMHACAFVTRIAERKLGLH